MALCIISGVEFPDVLTLSSVSIISKNITESLNFVTEASKLYSTKTPQGVINNLGIKVGNCIVFEVF